MAKQTRSSKPQSETKAPAPNLFEVAGSVQVGAKAKPSRPELALKGLKRYATICQQLADLEAEQETLRGDLIAGGILDHFVQAGCQRKARPENVRGVEDTASASIELRKRSTNSALSEDDQELLKANGIEFGTQTEFVIGKDYCSNTEALAVVSAALQKEIPDFNKKYPGFFQKKEKAVATDDSLNQVFQHGDNIARSLLQVVSVIGIKPTLGNK